MQFRSDVVDCVVKIWALVGEASLFLVFKVGTRRCCKILDLISRSTLLARCFPEACCFFSRCETKQKSDRKLAACRRLQVGSMAESNFHIYEALLAAGVRCFRTVECNCPKKELDYRDNFSHPVVAAVHAFTDELAQHRQRLGWPIAPIKASLNKQPTTVTQASQQMVLDPTPFVECHIFVQYIAVGSEIRQ